MTNKRKGDEGGLCFSAKYVIRSTLVSLLRRKKLCFPMRKLQLFTQDKTGKQSTA